MAKKLKRKEERKLLFQIKKKMEKQAEKEAKEKQVSKKRGKVFLSVFKPKKMKATRRVVSRRARGTGKLFTALAGTEKKGRGRPEGTYKYGMPISEYKKLQARKKTLQKQYQEEQLGEFRRRGINPETLRRMQLARTMEEGIPQQQIIKKGDMPEKIVDNELAFKKWEAKKVLSPSAQKILIRLRRTQNLGKSANIRQQRIQEERRIISQKANLFKAHENMIPVRLDFTGVDDDTNILMAPSVFKENPEDNILRQNRPSLLNTKEMGNDLRF